MATDHVLRWRRCIGGNKILLEDGASKLFFDFGKNFGEEGEFYEEFIQPKTVRGPL